MNSNEFQDLFLKKRAIRILNSLMNNSQRAPQISQPGLCPTHYYMPSPSRIFRPVIQGQKFCGMALAFWQTVVQKFTQAQIRSSHLKMRPGPIRT